jgi:hypothetical protein
MSVEKLKIEGFEPSFENMEKLLNSIEDDDGEEHYDIASEL